MSVSSSQDTQCGHSVWCEPCYSSQQREASALRPVPTGEGLTGHTARKDGNQVWQVCSSKPRYFPSFQMLSSCYLGLLGHRVVREEEGEAQRGADLPSVTGHTVGHRPVRAPGCLLSAPPLWHTYRHAPRRSPPRRCCCCRGQGCLGVWFFCGCTPFTLLPPVSPGVPRTTTWTTPQRCCRSGWPLWAMTMQPWSGGLRASPGGELGGGGGGGDRQ